MDQEQQRDHAEEQANAAAMREEQVESEEFGEDRMTIDIRQWSPGECRFLDYAKWPIREPWADRAEAEWFGIVTTHVPRDLPVGIYAFRLWRGTVLVARGEFAWDGRVATRREGVSAP